MSDYNALQLKLREANNQIAQLKYELESLRQDAGAEIHDMIVRHKTRITAASTLAELAELFVDDLDDRIIYPSFIGRSFTVYDCRLCGGSNRTSADIEHAHDCLYERTRLALRKYREADNG